MEKNNTYDFKVAILGHEVFAFSISTSDSSNRYVAISLVAAFSILTLLGAYGDKAVALYNSLIK